MTPWPNWTPPQQVEYLKEYIDRLDRYGESLRAAYRRNMEKGLPQNEELSRKRYKLGIEIVRAEEQMNGIVINELIPYLAQHRAIPVSPEWYYTRAGGC